MYQQQLQNFTNENYTPEITNYIQYPDPSQNEPFNRATFPGDKPIIGKHIFAVDSRQRNYEIYPFANNYSLSIPDKYRNVTGIELKAAMLPRTEYNVNTCNKYLDFSVGDYIAHIQIKNENKQVRNVNPNSGLLPPTRITTVNDEQELLWPLYPNGPYPLEISHPILPGNKATISVTIMNGYITGTPAITFAGSGYSHTKPPQVYILDSNYTSEDFIITVGKLYTAELREGQYKIGGNPEMNNVATAPESQQGWVPMNLVAEIENAMSYAILKDNSDFTSISPLPAGPPNSENYCYGRIPWTSLVPVGLPPVASALARNDYPLLFTTRIMSQYPTIDTYESNRISPQNFETNSCRFNRIYITNVLIFRTTDVYAPSDTITDTSGAYTVLKVDHIPGGGQIIYCNLNDALNVPWWTGATIVDSNPAHWEFLFASGENKIINSAELLGFNKKNYYHSFSDSLTGSLTESITDPIEIEHLISTTTPANTTLVPKGITYSSENDYYLIGDPEYIVLSFGSRSGGNSFAVLNDRVDSNTDSNINGVFACLIFDAMQPAVLEDVTSGQSVTILNSMGNTNIANHSYISTDTKYPEVLQLMGNTGSLNSEKKIPGLLKAMKGSDFDKKLIEFIQPIAQMSDLSIRFTKFTKDLNAGKDKELYDFHGKEHLLLFEITCGDLMTGKRF